MGGSGKWPLIRVEPNEEWKCIRIYLNLFQVLQLNINSQQSTIDNLNEKAQNLQQKSSSDADLNGQIRQIVEKYNRLCGDARVMIYYPTKSFTQEILWH